MGYFPRFLGLAPPVAYKYDPVARFPVNGPGFHLEEPRGLHQGTQLPEPVVPGVEGRGLVGDVLPHVAEGGPTIPRRRRRRRCCEGG